MSYGHLIAAWKVTGLTPREKVVLLALADCMNATTGMCFPSAPPHRRDDGDSSPERMEGARASRRERIDYADQSGTG